MDRYGNYQYNTLAEKEIRLFKLDITDFPEPLSGKLITFRHPCHFDPSAKNIAGMYRHWSDLRFVEKGGGKGGEGANGREGWGYDALSYAWGQLQVVYPLLLSTATKVTKNGKPDTKDIVGRRGKIKIHSNLYAVLQQLRRKRYSRFIWIDAICINQEDDAEKSTQISMMRTVYYEASCVLVWLGEASELEEGALAIMQAVTKILQKAVDTQHMLDPDLPGTFSSVGLPEPSHGIWSAFGSLMSRPWFRRLWTLQEVVLPEIIQVLCGSKSTNWETLEDFVQVIRRCELDDWTINGHRGLVEDKLQGYAATLIIQVCRVSIKHLHWGVKPSMLMNATRKREATNSIDMVFGMLGLVAPGVFDEIGIDVSLPVQSVFVQLAKYYVRNEPDECLLNHVSAREKLDGLPSWCPNFASPEETTSLHSLWMNDRLIQSNRESQMYRAGFKLQGEWVKPTNEKIVWIVIKNSTHRRHPLQNVYNTNNPRQITLISDSNNIRVSGMAIDEVVEVIDCNQGVESAYFYNFNSIHQTHYWEASCLTLAKCTLKDTSDIPEVYWRTLIANFIYDRLGDDVIFWDQHDRMDLLKAYQGFKELLQVTVDLGECISEDILTPWVKLFCARMIRATRRRRFFATRDGRVGLGPSDTQVGDAVCVLFFCPTPYVLRHRPLGTSRLVGEVYVHGLMYSEALDMLDQGLVDETQWVIE